MATTTNYGWSTPDDSALVKDGASAIRTLGSSIDTTLKAQIDAQIPDSLLTTKGDLIAATGASTPARLGVGTNGQALIADSTAATGMKWDTPAAGGMTLISTTTLSGASVVLSSIPQTYNNLYLVIRSFKPATDTQSIRLRINNDSTASRYSNTGVDQGNNQSFDSDRWQILDTQDNASDNSLGTFTIYDYTNTATWKIGLGISITNNAATPTNFNFFNRMYSYNQTPAISSLTLFTSSGNFTSGTVLLYGVK